MKTIKKLRNNTASLNIEKSFENSFTLSSNSIKNDFLFSERNLGPEMHPPKMVFITH